MPKNKAGAPAPTTTLVAPAMSLLGSTNDAAAAAPESRSFKFPLFLVFFQNIVEILNGLKTGEENDVAGACDRIFELMGNSPTLVFGTHKKMEDDSFEMLVDDDGKPALADSCSLWAWDPDSEFVKDLPSGAKGLLLRTWSGYWDRKEKRAIPPQITAALMKPILAAYQASVDGAAPAETAEIPAGAAAPAASIGEAVEAK